MSMIFYPFLHRTQLWWIMVDPGGWGLTGNLSALMQLRPFVAEMRAKVPVSELPGTPGVVSGDSVKMF